MTTLLEALKKANLVDKEKAEALEREEAEKLSNSSKIVKDDFDKDAGKVVLP